MFASIPTLLALKVFWVIFAKYKITFELTQKPERKKFTHIEKNQRDNNKP